MTRSLIGSLAAHVYLAGADRCSTQAYTADRGAIVSIPWTPALAASTRAANARGRAATNLHRRDGRAR